MPLIDLVFLGVLAGAVLSCLGALFVMGRRVKAARDGQAEEGRRVAALRDTLARLEKVNSEVEQKLHDLGSMREDLAGHLKQRDLLIDLTQSLTQTLDLKELLTGMLQKIRDLIGFHSGGVFLFNQDKTDMSVAATVGFYEEEMASQLSPDMGLPAIVAQTNRPQISADVDTDPRFATIRAATRIHSAIYHPIALDREVYGVICLWHMDRDAYEKRHIGMLGSITSQAARAIKNAEVYQELDTRLNFIVTLWETSKSLTSSSVDSTSLAWEKVLEEVIGSIRYQFRSEKAVFFRWDKDRRALMPQITQGLSEAGRHDLGVAINQSSQGLPFFLDSTFQVKDCLKDSRFGDLTPVAVAEDIHGVLWAPLLGRNMTIGALALMSSRSRVWTLMELQWVDIFAKMFSMTLENMFLFQDLASEKSQLQVLIDNVPEGVFTVDAEGLVLTWNAAAQHITGWTLAEMAGHTCGDFIKCQNVDEVWCQKRCPLRVAMGTQAKYDSGVDTVFVIHSGTSARIPVFITSAPIYNEEGRISGAILVFRDITKEREIEQMKEDFLATITHDLKSPLASVMGYTELLLNPKLGETNPTQREFLEAIARSSKTLQFLIDNILEITRMEAGKMLFNPGLFNIEALVSEINEMFRPLAAPKNLRLDSFVDESVIVYGDRDKIKEIFINLYSNAIKFTKERGVITVRVEPDGPTRVTIHVSDTGKGIPADQIARLFHKFAQLKSDERRGTGLGLYIVKRILDAHGETISVESREGVGTTFTFGMPRFKPGSAAAPTRTVLILERDRQMSEVVRRTLAEEGINAITANTPRDALGLVQNQRPAVLVIDSQVPEVSDQRYLGELKRIAAASGQTLRVLLICEWRQPVPDDADANISRPVNPNELLRKVRILMEADEDSRAI